MTERQKRVAIVTVGMVLWSLLCYYAFGLNMNAYVTSRWLGSFDLAPIALGTAIGTWALWILGLALLFVKGIE